MGVTTRVLNKAARRPSGKPAFENFEEGITPEDMAQAQQLQIDSSVANEELQAIEAELAEGDTEGDVLDSAVNTYPEVVEMIQQDIDENGGVSTESAKYIDFILRQAGLGGVINVSVENFSDPSRRLRETTVSLEGLKETLRNWWENFIAWWGKQREKIKKWWIKTFSNAAGIQKRAESIVQRAQNVTKGQPKEKKLSFSRLQSTLFLKNAMPEPAALLTALKTMTGIGEEVFGAWQKKGIDDAEALLEIVGAANLDNEAGVKAFADALTQKISGMTFRPSGFTTVTGAETNIPEEFSTGKVQGNRTVSRTDEMPGGKAVYLIQMNGNMNTGGTSTDPIEKLTNTVAWLSTRRFILSSFNTKNKEDGEVQITTWTPTQIVDLCNEVQTMARLIEQYQQNFKAQEKANADIDKFKKAGDANVQGDAEALAAKAQNQLKRMPTPLREMINEPASRYGAHFMAVMNSILSVSERSLAQY